MSIFDWLGVPDGLVRDPARGRIAGVCVGLGDYFQIRPKFIRLALILGSIFGLFVPIVIGYALLAWIMPVAQPATLSGRWNRGRTYEDAPSFSWDRVNTLGRRFADLDGRLAGLEAKVTSDEFRLRQQFRNL